MIIRSLSGDADISNAMTKAMEATLDALVEESKLSHKEATAFANTHVIILVTNDSVFYRIRKWFKKNIAEDDAYPMVFKCIAQEQPSDENGQINEHSKSGGRKED